MYLLHFSATRSHGVVIPLTAALAIVALKKKNVNIDLKNSFGHNVYSAKWAIGNVVQLLEKWIPQKRTYLN